MTPQERQRVEGLFARLARLENAQQDREAAALIVEGLRQAPNSPYAMVQTILVQEEALERANERIRQLEEGADGAPAQPGGFLDSLRGALSGQPAAPRRGSVPATRGNGAPKGAPMGVPPAFGQGAQAQEQQGQQIGRGGSFLGQAASIAAGVVVGSMVVDALRGQFGSEAGKSAAQEQAAQDTGAQQANYERESAPEDASYEAADYDDGGGFGGGGDFDFG